MADIEKINWSKRESQRNMVRAKEKALCSPRTFMVENSVDVLRYA